MVLGRQQSVVQPPGDRHVGAEEGHVGIRSPLNLLGYGLAMSTFCSRELMVTWETDAGTDTTSQARVASAGTVTVPTGTW